VSLLSVNQYSLERTYESIEACGAGVVQAYHLQQWDHVEFVARLKAGGCDRGNS